MDIDDDKPQEPQTSTPPETPRRKRGFLAKLVTIFLILLLAGSASAGAWYWQQQSIDSLKSKVSQLEKREDDLEKELAAEKQPIDKTAAWVKYVNQEGKFSLKHDTAWSTKVCDGNTTTVYIGVSEETQAICATEKGAIISVVSRAGDQRFFPGHKFSDYAKDISKESVTLNGVTGEKASYTHTGNEFVAAGTKDVIYEFYTNGQTYNINYSRAPSYPDALTDFELMVNKTFRFAAE